MMNFGKLGLQCGLMLSAGVLAGCGSGGVSFTSSSNASVNASNVVSVSLNDELNNNLGNASGVGLVAYVTGAEGSSTARTLSGSRNVNVGAPVTTGTASYSGQIGAAVADTSIGGSVLGAATNPINIALIADFDAGTLKGSASAGSGFNSGTFTVDGTIQGQTLGGEVDVDVSFSSGFDFLSVDLKTDLSGTIGADGAVGTFDGTTSDSSASGGFVVERD